MQVTETELDELVYRRAIRLLVLGNGKHIWEASPSPLHQMLIDEIRATIQPVASGDMARSGCGCFHLADVYIRLPDTSLVRPDIAIFCERPPRQRQALRVVPAAVIEVISPTYEVKDLEDLPPVYLSNGIRDVLVVDSDQQRVTHFQHAGTTVYSTPHTARFACGCECFVG